MFLLKRPHLTRSCASSHDNSLSDKSFLMLSNHFRFGLHLLLFPGTSIFITLLPTHSSSLLNTCPYHFNLLSCIFLDISHTSVVPLIVSFLIILSNLVTPIIHLRHIQLDARKQLFAQDCREIDALTPNLAVFIQHAKRATYQAGGCCGQMMIAAPEVSSHSEWVGSERQCMMGNIMDNSFRGDTSLLATPSMQLQERLQRAVQMAQGSTPMHGYVLLRRTL